MDETEVQVREQICTKQKLSKIIFSIVGTIREKNIFLIKKKILVF